MVMFAGVKQSSLAGLTAMVIEYLLALSNPITNKVP